MMTRTKNNELVDKNKFIEVENWKKIENFLAFL